jgi:PAS domain S-box-containing protein
MPLQRNDRLISIIDRLALLVALTVALILPLGYSSLAYRNLVYHVDTQAQVKAGAITALVSGNPSLWTYQVQLMEDRLAHYPAPIEDEAASAFDANGVLLVRVGNPPEQPMLQRSHALYDSGRVVGRVEAAHSLRGLIYGAALAALLGLLLGGAVYGVLRTWPLRVLRRMSVALDAEHAAMRASEERWKFALEGARDGVWDRNRQTGEVVYSARYKEMYGYTEDDAGERLARWQERIHPEDLPRVLGDRQAYFDGKTAIYANERRMQCKDGSWKWILARGMVVSRDATGKPLRMIGTHTDITQRKQIEEALRASEERYRTVADFTYDWEYWRSPDGSLPYVSPSCLRVTGYRASEFQQDPGLLLRIVHADDRDELDRHLHAVEKPETNTDHYELDFRIITREGEERWIAHICQHISDQDGKYLGRRACNRDVTGRKHAEAERKQLEAQLRESQKMEALGTLAGGIAHDFNNVLTTISGNVELARQDVGAAHAAQESLEEIGKATRRAKNLVQQILAFGRRQVLDRKAISLAPVVQESTRLLRATLPAGMRLDVECAPDAPQVLADATQIQQILLNLCGNAWHAIEGQARAGVIEVRLEAHCVDEAPHLGQERQSGGARAFFRPGRYACLTVRDNGSGMDEATRSRIFEPFFTTKPVGEGTGLGLAVVHGIVQAHEASIAVHSEPGIGTSFRIYFPAVDASVPAVAEREPLLVRKSNGDALVLQGEGKHILYVDDDDAIVFLMTRLLERRGYRVSGYTDALAAIAAVRAEPGQFDLAVTDYNMPGMSGLDVAQALRELRADLPVALASGYITEALRAKAPAAGVRELIFKPTSIEDLCDVVAQLASGAERSVTSQAKA